MAGTGKAHLRDSDRAVLRAEDLVVEFPLRRGRAVHAVSGISFDALDGETVGIVGESGCGKSTTGRALMQLPPPTSGSVVFEGHDLTTVRGDAMRRARRPLQMIFQDPASSLNPLRRVKDIVAEGFEIWPEAADRDPARQVDEMLAAVGLDPDAVGDRRPHEFSGGQCQRICIARALLLRPRVLVCDEPVSALDVSVQAQIMNLLEDMKDEHGLTMLFIAHDLAVVKNISDRIIVMYLGKICEVGPAAGLYEAPAHPYTDALIRAIPDPDPTAPVSVGTLRGELPSPIEPPTGCRFHTRCPRAERRCSVEEPQLREVAPDHFVACHFPNTVPTGLGVSETPTVIRSP